MTLKYSLKTRASKRKKGFLRLKIFILITIVLVIYFLLFFIIRNLFTNQQTNPELNHPPQFSKNKPIARMIDIHLGFIPDENPTYPPTYDLLTAKGNYLLHLMPIQDGLYTNNDTLLYNGSIIYEGSIEQYVLSKDGKHYAFTTVVPNTRNTSLEINSLYVDGEPVLSSQKNIILDAISNNGQYLYTEQEDANNNKHVNVYLSGKVIQTVDSSCSHLISLLFYNGG